MASAHAARMYAIVRKNVYDPAKVERSHEQLARFDELHAQQPGFRGTITIDLGQNANVVINLWDSREAAKAGLEQMRPLVRELMEPLLATESLLIGEGTVLNNAVLAT